MAHATWLRPAFVTSFLLAAVMRRCSGDAQQDDVRQEVAAGASIALPEHTKGTPLPAHGRNRNHRTSSSDQRTAIVTLVSSASFTLTARVLRRSIISVGGRAATLPMVMLHTFEFSPRVRQQLLAEGWTLRQVERVANPFDDVGYKQRLVFTKLMVWDMEDAFERVIFLDADCVVQRDISHILDCRADFCAVQTSREALSGRFNSGVMALTPSRTLLQDMLAQTKTLHSYNRGDQGFLNAFIPNWCLGNSSNGLVGSWAEALRSSEAQNRCGELGLNDNFVAYLVGAHDTGYEAILHFNHPVWWVVKPWCWPAYPTHWILWEWRRHRVALADESTKAQTQMLLAIWLPLFASLAAWLIAPTSRSRSGLLPVAQDRETSDSRHWRKIFARLVETHTSVQAMHAASVTCFGLVFGAFVLPGDMDAVAAWLTYAMVKASLGGVAAIRWGSGASCAGSRARLYFILAYYGAVALEMLIMWTPTLILGWFWTSDRMLMPICRMGGILQTTVSCTTVAIALFAVLPMAASFFAIFFAHRCLPTGGSIVEIADAKTA